MSRNHLANRRLAWSPLNRPPEIMDAAAGRVDWSGHPRSLVIYGAGEGRRQAPLDEPGHTVWAMNLIPPYDSLGRVRADAWWDVHQRCAQTDDDMRWIAACPVPIYVPGDLLHASPRAVRYPHERAEAAYGSYWACTFAYQIALAMLEGFAEIGLYGVDLAHGTMRERTAEWACVSWWMGFAEAKGVRFRLPSGSLMGRHPHRYGLEYTAELEAVKAYVAQMERRDRGARVLREAAIAAGEPGADAIE